VTLRPLICAVALVVAASGCYTGAARDVSPRQVAEAQGDPTWRLVDDVPFVAQQSDNDCGSAALTMALAHYQLPPARLPLDAQGVRAGDLRDAARARGLQAFVVSGTFGDLLDQVGRGRPVVVGLAKPLSSGRALAHYEVVVGLNRDRRLIRSLDPARGLRENSFEGFAREWVPTRQVMIVMFPAVEPPGQAPQPGPAPAPAVAPTTSSSPPAPSASSPS
jgi:ABC-type bacteriocin/lantibiotic exporter with double-glycine peptidase domain